MGAQFLRAIFIFRKMAIEMKPDRQRVAHLSLFKARDTKISWKERGPFFSERRWGTVRKDYSEGGDVSGEE